MILTKKQEISLYAWCIHEGINIEYGKLSLCDLRNFHYSEVKNNRRYQVHSDDRVYPWSMIYEDLEPAIVKFMELKRKVKRVR